MKPLLSIGLTTYNRIDYLKNCLNSIISQGDFNLEILVGNDFVSQNITLGDLGITDSRITTFNHAKNLGELANLNFLMNAASGEYFIWMADDDEFNLDSLTLIWPYLDRLNDFIVPLCVTGTSLDNHPINLQTKLMKLTRQDFLQDYINKKIHLQGVYIFYKTTLLKELGGIKPMGECKTPSLYADTSLVFQLMTKYESCNFMPAPVALFRVHDESISNTSADLNSLQCAQQKYLHDSVDWTHDKSIGYNKIFYLLINKWFVGDFINVGLRNHGIQFQNILKFYFLILKSSSIIGIFNTFKLFFSFTFRLRQVVKAYLKNLL